MRILIAHRDQEGEERIAAALEEGGFEAVRAGDERTLGEKLGAGNFDLAILDTRLENTDAVQASRRLKVRSGGFMPVLLLGENGADDLRLDSLDAGVDDFLSEPPETRELLARIRNLCRIKAMHDDLRHLAKVQEQVVYTMSHDLQTPLVGIRGAVQNLLKGLVGPLSPDQRGYLEMVENSARKLSELTSSLCRSAKRRRGGGLRAHEPVDMKRTINTAVTGLRPAMVKMGLLLTVEIEPKAPQAWGDRTRLAQVLANLIDNAVKHSPEGGTILVRVERERVSGRDHVHVTVEDEGPGIPKEDCERIFSRPGGNGRSGEGPVPGAGMGLAICKETIEALGGRIWLESDSGEGARFHIQVPAASSKRGAV